MKTNDFVANHTVDKLIPLFHYQKLHSQYQIFDILSILWLNPILPRGGANFALPSGFFQISIFLFEIEP